MHETRYWSRKSIPYHEGCGDNLWEKQMSLMTEECPAKVKTRNTGLVHSNGLKYYLMGYSYFMNLPLSIIIFYSSSAKMQGCWWKKFKFPSCSVLVVNGHKDALSLLHPSPTKFPPNMLPVNLSHWWITYHTKNVFVDVRSLQVLPVTACVLQFPLHTSQRCRWVVDSGGNW